MTTDGNGKYVYLVIHEKDHNDKFVYACASIKAAEDKILEVAGLECDSLEDKYESECVKAIEKKDDERITDLWGQWTEYEQSLDIVARELLEIVPTTLDIMEESKS